MQSPEPTVEGVTLVGLDEVLITLGPGEPGRDIDFVDFPVVISGNGLDVRSWVPDLKGHLVAFVGEIADDWKGERSDRRWESIEHDMSIEATRSPTGHVSMLFTLRGGRRPAEEPTWSVAVTVRLEAGEQISAIASNLRAALLPSS